MSAFVFPVLSVVYALLLVAVGRRFFLHRRAANAWRFVFVLALGAGALITSLGTALGEGESLRQLSWIRLGWRAVAYPAAIGAAYDLVRRTDVPWMRVPRASQAIALLCAALALWNGYALIHGAALAVDHFDGILRYKSTTVAGPTTAEIFAITLLLALGMMLFRRINSPWMTCAAILLFFANVFPVSLVGPTASAIAEAIFALSLSNQETTENTTGVEPA